MLLKRNNTFKTVMIYVIYIVLVLIFLFGIELRTPAISIPMMAGATIGLALLYDKTDLFWKDIDKIERDIEDRY